jgi:hypothetical protein
VSDAPAAPTRKMPGALPFAPGPRVFREAFMVAVRACASRAHDVRGARRGVYPQIVHKDDGNCVERCCEGHLVFPGDSLQC